MSLHYEGTVWHWCLAPPGSLRNGAVVRTRLFDLQWRRYKPVVVAIRSRSLTLST